jgi:hypothetical protein
MIRRVTSSKSTKSENPQPRPRRGTRAAQKLRSGRGDRREHSWIRQYAVFGWMSRRRSKLLVARVVGLIEAPRLGLDLPLEYAAQLFSSGCRRRCATFRRAAPSLTRISLARLAHQIGACGRWCVRGQQIAVAIPCHRVVTKRWFAFRLSVGRRTQARSDRREASTI